MSANILKFPVRRKVRLTRAVRAPVSRVARRFETHLAEAQAVARLGSWEIDLATGATLVSPEMRRIMGWGPRVRADLSRILEVAHPDDRGRVEDWLGRNIALRPPEGGCFFRIVRNDGTLGTLFGRSAVRPYRDGGPPRVCGTVQDVTEQGATERAINEAAHLYRDIFENCAWGVFQTTADGRYLTANPALARIYGYESPSELLSRLTDIGGQLYVDPGRRDAFVAAMRERGFVHGFESQVYRRDGAIIWICETCREVRTSTGRLLYYEGTVEDVSERKRNEAELIRATAAAEAANREVQAINQELEKRVELRTAELKALQEQLLKQERLSTLGKLTATVAHELRNPLSAMRNSLHVVRDAAASEGLALDRPLGRIERGIARCDRIVCDLVDYAHVRRLDRRATNLDTWLADWLETYCVPDGITLECRQGAAGALVRIDTERFGRALANILDNAVQALEEDRCSAERRITIVTAGGAAVSVLIEDTGPGIPADILPNVFDVLFSTKNFGTGLGLPTARQIVEQHNGTVEIASSGRGTIVRIEMPRATR
jgi:PAS domain S-box-containing protein